MNNSKLSVVTRLGWLAAGITTGVVGLAAFQGHACPLLPELELAFGRFPRALGGLERRDESGDVAACLGRCKPFKVKVVVHGDPRRYSTASRVRCHLLAIRSPSG